MLFDEIYGSYYRTVAEILKLALQRPVRQSDLTALCRMYSFGEAYLNIPEKLMDGSWPLLEEVPGAKPKAWTAVTDHVPQTPLTLLERRWLRAISLDPRIALFDVDLSFVGDVEPLFYPGDVICFDCYGDGDDYADPVYQANFRALLTAIEEARSVKMTYESRRNRVATDVVTPLRMEYSEKDDRFRVLCASGQNVVVRNMAGVRECVPGEEYEGELPDPDVRKARCVLLEIRDHRNAMERVSLHFTHLRKEVERVDRFVYRMKLWYDPTDEREMIIRVLQFGPAVRVVGPASFRDAVRRRVERQMQLLAGRINPAGEQK